MGDEHDDDPFETYIGTTDELEDDAPARRWSWPAGVFTRPMWAITGLIVATASLLGITAGQFIGEFLSLDSGGYTGQAASPAIDAGFAAGAIVFAVLGLREDEDLETTWHRMLAGAAIVLAILSILVNLAAVGTALHASDPSSSSAVSSATG